MAPLSTAAAVPSPVFIIHPTTLETWEISSLLQVMYVLGAQNPSQMAEVIFDIARYVAAEQYSAQDTSARLRLTLARLDYLGTAFDSIEVRAMTPLAPIMRAL